MPEDLSTGIALCTAWERGDLESWAKIAQENGAVDRRTLLTMGEVSHVAVELARALAAAEGEVDPEDILSQIALQGLNDGDDRRLEIYRGLSRWVDAEPTDQP